MNATEYNAHSVNLLPPARDAGGAPHVAIARALAAPAHKMPVQARSNFDRMSIHEMHILYETHETVENTLLAFTNQPRCGGLASKEIDRLSTAIAELRYVLLQRMQAVTPQNETEALKRGEVLSRYFFSSGGDDARELRAIADSVIAHQPSDSPLRDGGSQ